MEVLREWLWSQSEEAYQKFSAKLIPGEQKIMGIRIPILRKKAKQLAKQDWKSICTEILKHLEIDDCYMEEKLLFGFLIGYADMKDTERIHWLDQWICWIDNWSVCDSGCMTYQFMKKNRSLWWEYIQKWLKSSKEFEVRFGVVALLGHFVTEAYIDPVLETLIKIQHEGYYVKMAVAWAVSVCYVSYPEKTEQVLQQKILDLFTQNKAIQKICESFRVTKEQKQLVRNWKITVG